MKLVRHNTLVNELVLVDGVGRSGKKLLSRIINSFDRVEKHHTDIAFDSIPRYYMLGKMDKDAAISFLNILADTKLYNCMLSKEENFRPNDHDSIYNTDNPEKYIKRLSNTLKGDILDRIEEEIPILQINTHSNLRNANLLFDAFRDRLKILHIERNTEDVIDSWYSKGFGSRMGIDPLDCHICFEWEKYEWGKFQIPYYFEDMEQTYLDMSSKQRLTHIINYNKKWNNIGYEQLSKHRKSRVFKIKFEELVTDSHKMCEDIASFLGTSTTDYTKEVLKREKCSR